MAAKTKMPRWVWGAASLAVVAVAVWAWWGRGGAGGPPGGFGGGAVAVEAVTAQQGPMAETLTVAGQVQARTGAELRSEVTARLMAVRVSDGAAVKQGAPLLVLDDSVQRAALAQAQANLELAQANIQRYRRLVEIGAASRLQVDQAAAEAKLQAANVQAARANLARYQIAAPFDGVAGIVQVNVGELVQPGQLLVAVTNNDSLKVTFKVPAAQANSLHEGAGVLVLTEGLEISGTITALDGRVDPATRTLEGKVELDNADGALVAGQFVRVRVPVRAVSDAVIVPDQALLPQGNEVHVFVVVPGDDGSQMASRTTVQVGLRSGGMAQIAEGVQAGQMVVTAGQQKLQAPTMEVTVQSPTTITVTPQAVEELR